MGCVMGENNFGKSRFLDAWARRIRRRGTILIMGDCEGTACRSTEQ